MLLNNRDKAVLRMEAKWQALLLEEIGADLGFDVDVDHATEFRYKQFIEEAKQLNKGKETDE